MTTTLRYSPDLALPLDAVTQRFSFLGRIGSGKTYGATKLAELMLDAGAQVVALDPVGLWYGLRVAGKGAGYSLPVFGGLHGDVPLESGAGAIMADLIVDRGLSCVLDVSQFESDADKSRFAAAFAKRFFFRKKAAPSAVHVFLEECQEFVPQNPQPKETDMLHEWTRMAKLGRNFGIGLSLISQRPQEVNKKVLNLTECLVAFQMTGAHERKAIREWIASVGADENILNVLPSLPVGMAHIYSPQWLRISKQIKAAPKNSADVSSTPRVGASPVEAKPLTKVDLAALRDVMAATIEKAKADDPKELRKRIAELERAAASKSPVADERAIERAVRECQRTNTEKYEGMSKAFGGFLENMGRVSREMEQAALYVRERVEKVGAVRLDMIEAARNAAPVLPSSRPAAAPIRPTPPARAVRATSAEGVSLPKGERLCLIAIASYDEGVERDQLSILSGYKRSTRDAYVQRLGERRYVEVRGAQILATKAGIDALGTDYEPLPTGEALQQYWLDRLPEGERRVLAILLDGKTHSRDEISDRTGYKRSTRDAYIQRLATRRLIDTTSAGVIARDTLFS